MRAFRCDECKGLHEGEEFATRVIASPRSEEPRDTNSTVGSTEKQEDICEECLRASIKGVVLGLREARLPITAIINVASDEVDFHISGHFVKSLSLDHWLPDDEIIKALLEVSTEELPGESIWRSGVFPRANGNKGVIIDFGGVVAHFRPEYKRGMDAPRIRAKAKYDVRSQVGDSQPYPWSVLPIDEFSNPVGQQVASFSLEEIDMLLNSLRELKEWGESMKALDETEKQVEV